MTTSNTNSAQSTNSASLSGYSAIPPLPLINNGGIGAQGSNGQFLTANGSNGTSWMSQGITTAQPNAIQIGNPDPVITFRMDGDIITRSGTITAEDWISVIKLIKRLITDMSQDQDLVSKYPYIQDAAHTWFMNELKGKENGRMDDQDTL